MSRAGQGSGTGEKKREKERERGEEGEREVIGATRGARAEETARFRLLGFGNGRGKVESGSVSSSGCRPVKLEEEGFWSRATARFIVPARHHHRTHTRARAREIDSRTGRSWRLRSARDVRATDGGWPATTEQP